MIDIHCHILPGLDDGPSEMAESIAMAAIAAADGINTIVATPHIKDIIHPTEKLDRVVADLNRQLMDRDIPVKILRGADVSALLSSELVKGHTINGRRYMLLEFPHSHIPQNAADIIFRTMLQGMHPVITHPERNPSVIRDPEILRRFKDMDILIQVTAGSLTGYFGNTAKECAIYLLRNGLTDVLATDAHSSRDRRPVLSEAVEAASRIIGHEQALRLVTTNPKSIIEGRHLYAP